jgi:poly-gamma-glutamate system protein
MFIRVIVALAILALCLVVTELFSRDEEHPSAGTMQAAARRMARAERVVAQKRLSLGIEIDPALDPYRTGLIGVETSVLTTTLGDIVAKRTATNTAFAALIVRYFYELGLSAGDRIAVGASGSFPGILLAVLSACAEMGLEPIVITSIGASEYGANVEGLSDAEMMAACMDAGVLPYRPAAISPGADDDQGISSLYTLEPRDDLARYARNTAQTMHVPFILGKDAEDSFASHLEVYRRTGPIKVFVNIGGADINFGSGATSLKRKPGLILPSSWNHRTQSSKEPDVEVREGLLGYYLNSGVPVLHFLNIKGLALQAGIPVDGDPEAPIPFEIIHTRKKTKWPLVLGLLLAGTALVFFRKSSA